MKQLLINPKKNFYMLSFLTRGLSSLISEGNLFDASVICAEKQFN